MDKKSNKDLSPLGLRPFLPSKDYEISKKFYQAIGFELVWDADNVCELSHGKCSFLLQRYYQEEWANNSMLQLFVEDVEEAWSFLKSLNLSEQFPEVKLRPPKAESWAKVMYLHGPAGELWHITQVP